MWKHVPPARPSVTERFVGFYWNSVQNFFAKKHNKPELLLWKSTRWQSDFTSASFDRFRCNSDTEGLLVMLLSTGGRKAYFVCGERNYISLIFPMPLDRFGQNSVPEVSTEIYLAFVPYVPWKSALCKRYFYWKCQWITNLAFYMYCPMLVKFGIIYPHT